MFVVHKWEGRTCQARVMFPLILGASISVPLGIVVALIFAPYAKPFAVDFDVKMCDYGAVSVGRIYRKEISFRNVGSRPIALKRIQPSCSCVVSSYNKDVIPSGEKRSFTVEVSTQQLHAPSELRQEIVVEFVDGTVPPVKIEIRASVLPDVTVDQEIVRLSSSVGDEDEAVARLRVGRKMLEIESFRSVQLKCPWGIAYEEVSRDNDHVEFVLRAMPGILGEESGSVEVFWRAADSGSNSLARPSRSKLPETRKLTLPLVYTRNAVAPVELWPNHIHLVIDEKNLENTGIEQLTRREVVLRSVQLNKVEITSISLARKDDRELIGLLPKRNGGSRSAFIVWLKKVPDRTLFSTNLIVRYSGIHNEKSGSLTLPFQCITVGSH